MRLRYRGNDVYLAEGRHMVGREAACAVVLDSQRTSRRHARIVVEHGAVTIEDLNSANGVQVNGRRIGSAPHRLQEGDRLVVGDAELEVEETDATPSSSTRDRATRPTSTREGACADAAANTTTLHDDGFAVAGMMAERAIHTGRVSAAVEILHYPLARVLDDAKANHALPEQMVITGARYACMLAGATGDEKWLRYSFELLTAARLPCDDALARELDRALSRVRSPPARAIEQYSRTLNAMPMSWRRLRAKLHVDALVGQLARKG